MKYFLFRRPISCIVDMGMSFGEPKAADNMWTVQVSHRYRLDEQEIRDAVERGDVLMLTDEPKKRARDARGGTK